jgi:hypothetical protein
VFLPRRRPVVPPPAVPLDDTSPNGPAASPAGPVASDPAGPVRQAQLPDLAVLGQVLRSLQRMA